MHPAEILWTVVIGFVLVGSVGYFLSIFAIRRGYSKEVFSYRMLTIVFLAGIMLGFILGKII